MSRPRIRTIKPDAWADEKLGGRTSRDGRLLFAVLLTLADDEGRLRDLPAAILGHGYPYDEDAPALLGGWLEELVTARLVQRYVVAGQAYLTLPGWSRHQVINRPSPSELPPPPDAPVSGPPDRTVHGTIREDSVTPPGSFIAGREGKGKERRTSPNPSSASAGGEQDPAVKAAPRRTPALKALGTNPRARGTNPRARAARGQAAERAAAAARFAAMLGEPEPTDRAGWDRQHAAMRTATPPSTHAAWLEDLELVGVDGGVLVFDAPDSARPFLTRPHVERMVQACAASVGVRARLATTLEHEGRAAGAVA